MIIYNTCLVIIILVVCLDKEIAYRSYILFVVYIFKKATQVENENINIYHTFTIVLQKSYIMSFEQLFRAKLNFDYDKKQAQLQAVADRLDSLNSTSE